MIPSNDRECSRRARSETLCKFVATLTLFRANLNQKLELKRATDLIEASSGKRSLRQRALTAGAWTLGAHGFDLAVSLASNLVMTRLLFPEAYGLVAAASAPIVGLTLISDFGIHALIVQSSAGRSGRFPSFGLGIQFWRGIVIWLVLALFCALISSL